MSQANLRTTPKARPSRRAAYVIGAILLVVAIIGLLYMTDNLPFLPRTPKTHPTGSSYTKGEPSKPGQSSGNGSSSNRQDAKSSDTNKGPLIAPTGNFVSNHHPSLSNNPNGSGYLTSTCSTTPGATCQITFSKSGITKTLTAETTDAGGAAYWNNWQPSDIGLTQGSWSITAVAALGSRTLTTTDALPLEVGP